MVMQDYCSQPAFHCRYWISHARALLVCLPFSIFFAFQSKAEISTDSLKQEIRQAPDTQKIQLVEDLVWEYFSYNMDSAVLWGQKAIDIAQGFNDSKYKAKAHNVLGVAYYQKGSFNKAINNYVKALEYNEEIENKKAIASNHNNLGLAFFQIGDYNKALDHQMKALELKESLEDSLKLANAYNNIGMIYDALEDYDKAYEYYHKSVSLDKKYNNKKDVGGTYSNIGIIHHKQGDYQKAKHYYQKALHFADSLGLKSLKASINNNLGITFFQEEKFEESEKYFREALAIGKETNKPKALMESYYNLGRNYLERGDMDSAFFYLTEAEKIALDLGMKPSLVELYQLLSEAHEKSGNHKQALSYYKKYADWKDSVWDKENQQALQKARAKFESREKKKEIELLQKQDELQQAKIEKQNAIIYACIAIVLVLLILSSLLIWNHSKRKKAYKKLALKEKKLKEKQEAIEAQNEELRHMNEDKNHFIRILAHDLRNPLNQMQGMADLVLMDSENLNQDQKEHLYYIKEASEHANNMIAKLLDINALENKNIEPQLEKTDLKHILEKLVNQYHNKAQEKSIAIEWNIPSNLSTLDTDPYYCRQVFDNLINNALKYSPQQSTVYLTAYEEGEYLITEVKDEGPGISEKDQEKLFQKFQKLSAQPTGNEPSTGLGLSIVKKYVEALHGEVWCESEEGKGTAFLVKFPTVNALPRDGVQEEDSEKAVT